MQTKRIFSFTTLGAILTCLFFAGCGGGDDGDYEGVGKLVSDRNSARIARGIDKSNPDNKRAADSGKSIPPSAIKEEIQSGEGLFEEEVKVVGLSSGKVLARGRVFFDKNGKIVNIKIRKN